MQDLSRGLIPIPKQNPKYVAQARTFQQKQLAIKRLSWWQRLIMGVRRVKVKHESPVPPVDPQWENSPDPAKRERWARDLQQRHAYVKAENPTLLAKKLDHSERDLNRQKYRRQKVWLQVLIPSISAGVVFALIMYVIFK